MHPETTNRKPDLPDDDQFRSDRELALRVMQGEEWAVRELVERHEGVVFRLCLRMLGCRHDAEDVAQETFVRAVRSMGRWDASRPLLPWLLAIAANRCRTALSKRRDLVVDQLVMAESHASPADGYQGAADLCEEVELALATVKTWVHRARKELANILRRRGVVEPIAQVEEEDDLPTGRSAAAAIAG